MTITWPAIADAGTVVPPGPVMVTGKFAPRRVPSGWVTFAITRVPAPSIGIGLSVPPLDPIVSS